LVTNKEIINSVKEGAISGVPIIFGYFPVAMAFGLLAKNIHIPFIDACLFSIIVFAGASQFMALDLIKASVGTGSIILATFLLNLRHLMMSASLSVKLKKMKKHWLFFIAFGVTDETFSVSSLTKKPLNLPFLLTLHGVSYSSWVVGTMVGYFLGAMLPTAVQASLGIGLYAMFMALLIPEVKKSKQILFLSFLSGLIYAVINSFSIIPSSWSLIITILMATVLGSIFIKEDTREEIA
jgi:4-azaleucine resistance transporter AzlC